MRFREPSPRIQDGFACGHTKTDCGIMDDMPTDKDQPIARAAEILGKSQRTILRWIHAGKIPAQKVNGEWRVDISGVMPSERTEKADVTSEMAEEIADLKAEIDLLKSQLTTEKDGEVSDLRQEVFLLRSQATQKDAEISGLKREITLLRSQVTEKDRQIVELHTLLGRAQKAPPIPGKKRWWMFWKR